MTRTQKKAVTKVHGSKDLEKIKNELRAQAVLREDGCHGRITVHMGTCGIAAGARDVMGALALELATCGRRDVRITTSGCIGVCAQEPVMTVEVLGSQPVLYGNLDKDKARLIFRQHVLGGEPIAQLAIGAGGQITH